MATLRQRIVDLINFNPGIRYTNEDLTHALDAPAASVRRASLQAMTFGEISDGGPAYYNPSVVTYVANEL